jgi:parallel beta-helix repeat protein
VIFFNRTQIRVRWRVAWFAGVLLLLNTLGAQAAPPSCGETLISNTTLGSDLDCSGFDGPALQFDGSASNGVTLDCANHAITAGSKSALIASNVSGITIQNCVITTSVAFSHGVLLHNASNSQVSDNYIVTTADFAHGIEILQSPDNRISDNNILTIASSMRMRSGSNNNLVSNNTLVATEASSINIQSSSDNEVIDNTLGSPWGFLIQHNLLLHGGGMGIDSSGNIYAVENAFGSGGDGIGTVTGFTQIDRTTGALISVIPLLMGGNTIGFGFHALEVLPSGRILALSDAGTATALYDIDPIFGEVTEIVLTLPALRGLPNGLDATSETTLLATTNSGELLKIELTTPTTGNVTVIGQQGGAGPISRYTRRPEGHTP